MRGVAVLLLLAGGAVRCAVDAAGDGYHGTALRRIRGWPLVGGCASGG